ncbi:MAG: NIPSNAP family protein [Bacteroidota bacterium]
MKKLFLLLALVLIGFFTSSSVAQERDYYQVKIYKIDTGSQESRLDQYLQTAYLPALHKAGIKNVGVFKPIEGKNDSERFVMVFIPYRSLHEFEELEGKLKADKEYQKAGNAYIEAPHDDPPYQRIESMLLRSFSSMPHFAVPDLDSKPAERVYEFRSYEGATELLYERKVEMFDKAGETALFKKLGFNPVFFAEVISSAHMPHLIYMTTFSNEASRQKHWDAFRTSPEWEKMKNMERYANTVSSISKYLMYPTDYSDI